MSDALINWLGLGLGWGLIAAGVILLLLALFRDRSRGCRRCPRCWYSMQGVPAMTCPECGRTAKKERSLFRTRRRWRRAAAACFVALLGLAALYTAGAMRLGWVRAIPSPLLVAFGPIELADWDGSSRGAAFGMIVMLPANGAMTANPRPTLTGLWREDLAAELQHRARENELADWEALLLVRRLRLEAAAAGRELGVFDPAELDVDRAWAPEPARSRFEPMAPLGELRIIADHLAGAHKRTLGNAWPGFRPDVIILSEAETVYPVGPRILVWNSKAARELRGVLTNLHRAQLDKPVPANEADWAAAVEAHAHEGNQLESLSVFPDDWPTWLTRVYDVRDILGPRLTRSPSVSLKEAEGDLQGDVDGRAAVYVDNASVFNGRLIITTDVRDHRRIEAYLNHLRRWAGEDLRREP